MGKVGDMVAQYADVIPKEPQGKHDVYFDYGGSRLTCHTCQDDLTRTLLREPAVSTWPERLAEFRSKHPWSGHLPREWR